MSYYDIDKQLERVRMLQDDWDSYGAPAPSPESITRAERVLNQLIILRRWLPRRIVPAGEGGTALYWRGGPNDDNYAHVAFLNDGTRESRAIWTRGGVSGDWQSVCPAGPDIMEDIERDIVKVLTLIRSSLVSQVDVAGRRAWRETLPS